MARIANDNSGEGFGKADDNVIQPFQLEESGLRGRLVRLGSVLDDVLSAHNYPDAVSHLLAEALGLGMVLSSMLKYEGIFTLQTSTDGPVKTIVVDITSEGQVRGYAGYDAEAIAALEGEDGDRYAGIGYGDLVGKGYLAFTVDQGTHTERYQGIVAVEGDDLSHSVQHYFDQSEQILTSVRVAAGRVDGYWRAGAMMLQKVPDEGGEEPSDLGGKVISLADKVRRDEKTAAEKQEDWDRSVILMQTCTVDEFIDPALHSSELLLRLFHEEGVWIFEPKAVFKGCRCSEEKVINVLKSLSDEEIDHCIVDGQVEMICEFCSRAYVFSRDEVASAKARKD